MYTVSPFADTLPDALLAARRGSEHTIDALSVTVTLDMSTALPPAVVHIIHQQQKFALHKELLVSLK
jgi:hypothetical protein